MVDESDAEDVDSAVIRMLVSALVDRLLVVVVLIAADTAESTSGRSWPLMAVGLMALELAWRALNRRIFRLRKTGRRRAKCSC